MSHAFIAEQERIRTAPPGPTAPVPRCIWHLRTIVPSTCKSYEWNLVCEIDSYADEGDQCAGYIKARKWGKAPVWGQCVEAADHYRGTDGGPLYALEVDFMGARGRLTTGAAVLCVVGRASESATRNPLDTEVAHLDAFFRLVPYVPDWGHVKLNYLLRAEVKCEKAIVSMQGGDCVSYSDDPAVPVHRFDPQTGYIGYWKGRLAVWAVHAVTGQVVQMREFPA